MSGADFTEAGENVTSDLAEQLLDLETEIENCQDAKKAIYEAARETYGKRFTNALKLALKIKRTDEDKLAEADAVDAEAFRILAIINRPRAPRATPAIASAVPEVEHDPETGEIHQPETATPAHSPAATPADANAGGDHEAVIDAPIDTETATLVASGMENDNSVMTRADASGLALGSAVELSAPPLYADPGLVVMEHTPPAGIVAHPYIVAWPLREITLADGEEIREPIVKVDHFIVDGRQRYFAARAKGIEYPVVQYAGDDLLLDVIRWNMASRHMSVPALVMVAQKLAKLEPSRASEIMDLMGMPQEAAA